MSHSSVQKYSWRTGRDHLNQPNFANSVTWNVNTTLPGTLDVTGSTDLNDRLHYRDILNIMVIFWLTTSDGDTNIRIVLIVINL